MSNIIQYKGLTLETLQHVDERVDSIAGNEFEEIAVGENVFRFLPVVTGDPVRVTAVHYIDSVPGLEKMVVFACPRVELKQPCIACQKSEELAKTGNPIDRERAYRISAGLRCYANVVNRKRTDNSVKVLAFGKGIWDALKAIRQNARMGGDYTDPTENGFDIIITREGTGKNDTKYAVAADRQSSALAPTVEQINEIIMSTKNLDAFVDPTPSPELLLAWGGGRQITAGVAAQLAPGTGRQAAAPPTSGTAGAGVMARRPAANAPPITVQGVPVAQPAAVPAASAIASAAEMDDDFN
jgi:hypothetical protein